MPTSEDELARLSRGLNFYIKRLLVQIALAEGLPDLLNDYRSVFDLTSLSNIKDLKLLRELILSLSRLNIIDQKGDMFKWVGGEIRISKEEEDLKWLAEPWVILLKLYSKRFSRLLRGETPITLKETGIWDSLYSCHLYQKIWREAIDSLNIDDSSIILDVGCKTGWSAINILENYDPKNIISIDNNDGFLSVADENISNFIPDRRFKVSLVKHDFVKEIDFSGYLGDAKPDKVIVSYLFHWYDEGDYLNILGNIRRIVADHAKIVFIQPHIAYRNQSRFFELPLYSDERFRGYPLLESLANALVSSGFSIPER